MERFYQMQTKPNPTWKAQAVVGDDSAKFAADLEKALNDCSQEGFSLVHMIPRSTDNGIVLVHQRYEQTTFTAEGPATGTVVRPKGEN